MKKKYYYRLYEISTRHRQDWKEYTGETWEGFCAADVLQWIEEYLSVPDNDTTVEIRVEEVE